MASLTLTLPSPRGRRWDASRWPARGLQRHALRLALGAPYAALAVWASVRGVHSPVAEAVAHQGRAGRPGASPLAMLAGSYPPISVALGALLPGGATAVAAVGALGAGGILQVCAERLRQAALPWWVCVPLLAAIGALPVFWYVAANDPVGFLGLALASVALAAALDFTFNARTSGGFSAGIAFGLAVLCDPAVLVLVLSLIAALPLLARDRFRVERGSLVSTYTVLLFPTAAALAGWAFLAWRFTGSPFHEPFLAAAGAAGGPGHALAAAARSVVPLLRDSPLFDVAALLLLARRPPAFLALLLVPADLVATHWLGLALSAPASLVLLGVLAVGAVPQRPRLAVCLLLLTAAALAQMAWWAHAVVPVGQTGAWLRALGL